MKTIEIMALSGVFKRLHRVGTVLNMEVTTSSQCVAVLPGRLPHFSMAVSLPLARRAMRVDQKACFFAHPKYARAKKSDAAAIWRWRILYQDAGRGLCIAAQCDLCGYKKSFFEKYESDVRVLHPPERTALYPAGPKAIIYDKVDCTETGILIPGDGPGKLVIVAPNSDNRVPRRSYIEKRFPAGTHAILTEPSRKTRFVGVVACFGECC